LTQRGARGPCAGVVGTTACGAGVAAARERIAAPRAVRHAVRAAGLASAMAAPAGLGLPAVAAVAGLVVVLLAAVC
jgi:hypothetical protein